MFKIMANLVNHPEVRVSPLRAMKKTQTEGGSLEHDNWEDDGINLMMSTVNEFESVELPQKQSFANVVNGTVNIRPTKKVNFRAMVNPNKVDNSNFALPIVVVQAVEHKFENTLVGFFVGKKVAFLLVKNYNGVEQVLEQGPWLIRNVPLILTKWSPNFSLSKDEVTKLKDEVIMAIPKGVEENAGHTLVKINIEYEWKPLIFLDCHVFGHANDKCPKKEKGRPNNKNLSLAGQDDTYKAAVGESSNNGSKLKNLFEKLDEITTVVDPNSGMGEDDYFKKVDIQDTLYTEEIDSEVEEVYVEPRPNKPNIKGASTPSNDVSNSLLTDVCSRVFKVWEWTSNAHLCNKGCRIILGWNTDVVNIMVLS
ncbi:retrovirus-related pol polyprotein from transposon TNT 1-94 [Tanacetum coccineum]